MTISADIEELSAQKVRLNEELAESRAKNDRLEELGNEARDKLLSKVEEINALSNKSQLDKERLSTIERDTERFSDEKQELNAYIGCVHADCTHRNDYSLILGEFLIVQNALRAAEAFFQFRYKILSV